MGGDGAPTGTDGDLRRSWLRLLVWRPVYLTVLGVVAVVVFVITLIGGDGMSLGSWPARRRAIPGAFRASWIARSGHRWRRSSVTPIDRLRGLAPGWVTVAERSIVWTPADEGSPKSPTWGATLTGPIQIWTTPFGSRMVAMHLRDGADEGVAHLLVRRWHREPVPGATIGGDGEVDQADPRGRSDRRSGVRALEGHRPTHP